MKYALILFTLTAFTATAAPAADRPEAPCHGASSASAPSVGCVNSGGQGHRWNGQDTPGWSMMGREERDAHRARMSSFQNREECRAYLDEHHQAMSERAKQTGKPVPGSPRHDACAALPSKAAR